MGALDWTNKKFGAASKPTQSGLKPKLMGMLYVLEESNCSLTAALATPMSS
jgi:hypothetical protein